MNNDTGNLSINQIISLLRKSEDLDYEIFFTRKLKNRRYVSFLLT